MQLPETIIGTAFGLVALPTLSDLAARGDIDGLRDTLGETLRAVLALTVPAALGLILLGRPLLQILYQRGAFDATATEAVFVALRFYALGLVGHACLELAARAFFSQQDTVTPLLVAAASAAVNIVLGIVLRAPMGHGGLALANSLAISAEVVVLLLILRRRWHGVQGRQTLVALLRVLGATLVMGAAVYSVIWFGDRADLSPLLVVGIGTATGGLVYLLAGILFHVEGLRWALRAILERR
jgi:putative peptidoglycan lipid II flippase